MKTKLICLTPIKNESWILETFLKCASVWADHIIVADQMSTDDSRKIAQTFPKVTIVNNNSPVFNEPERVQLLLCEARKILGPKILIALDADEILSGNLKWLSSDEFRSVLPGTRLAFDWVNVHPSCRYFWNSNPPMTWGFVDDGSAHSGAKIHSGRVPEPIHSPLVHIKKVKVLHLQYIDWERMQSKHRWYQCYERINFPKRNPVSIYRMYHHMDAIRKKDMQHLDMSNLSAYIDASIDPFAHVKENIYHWDEDVDAMIREHGEKYFASIDIWPLNSYQNVNGATRDPRNFLHKLMHLYLRRTQQFSRKKTVRLLDDFVKCIFFLLNTCQTFGNRN